MSTWTRIHERASGALPINTITKWAVVLLTLTVAAFFLTTQLFQGGEDTLDVATPAEDAAGPRTQAQIAARVREEEQRQAVNAAAAARDLERQRGALGLVGGRVTAAAIPLPNGEPSPDGVTYASTEAEAELREVLRLEGIERERRSLRSEPVAYTYRSLSGGPGDLAASPSGASGAAPEPPDPTAPLGQSFTDSLEAFRVAVSDLETAQDAPELATADAGGPVARAPLAPHAAAVPRGDPARPAVVTQALDPPGWERIYEGSLIEAVLVNQLSGDFPGPVLASVAVPYYSADRQHIVVPRGARLVGTASAVAGQDQERLAVGFHRLIFPDGSWVSLDFQGLNHVGESALKDHVNRHYFSMFAAVGAVGVIAGLTVRGSNPYEGGAAGVRAGAGQGLAQGATNILDRFLNRLPTITIRAGHRLRIWLTSDVLVPRPELTARRPSSVTSHTPLPRTGDTR